MGSYDLTDNRVSDWGDEHILKIENCDGLHNVNTLNANNLCPEKWKKKKDALNKLPSNLPKDKVTQAG